MRKGEENYFRVVFCLFSLSTHKFHKPNLVITLSDFCHFFQGYHESERVSCSVVSDSLQPHGL